MTGRKRGETTGARAQDDARDQEVLRANKELAAYFKGRRTEREARAALKIIKAFVRDRARTDPATRRPLPGAQRAAKMAPDPQQPGPQQRARPGRPSLVRHGSDAVKAARPNSAPEDAPPRSTDD